MLALLALSGCSGGSPPGPQLGVSASPRVTASRTVPKGGGRYKVGRPYKVAGRWYFPHEVQRYDRTGTASWYGQAFHGRRTANGEIYDMGALTAGHPTLPLPSFAYVTNLQNGRTILVRVNDRGPYVRNRLIDLSWRSAKELGFLNRGLARVRVLYAGSAPLDGNDSAERGFLASQPWHGGTDAIAQVLSAEAATAALPEPQPGRPWTVADYRQQLDAAGRLASVRRRDGLGGPESAVVEIGPFASLAEAERMRHELRGLGVAAVEDTGTEDEPAFRVRLVPLDAAAGSAAEHIWQLGSATGVAAPR